MLLYLQFFYEAYLLKKYTNFPKEKQCFKTFFYIILIPFIINTLYTVLAFIMMAKIPSFSWWMVLLFIGITTTNFNFEMPMLANVRPFCAFTLLWVNIPDAVKITALPALIIAEILKWIDSWMEKKRPRKRKRQINWQRNWDWTMRRNCWAGWMIWKKTWTI